MVRYSAPSPGGRSPGWRAPRAPAPSRLARAARVLVYAATVAAGVGWVLVRLSSDANAFGMLVAFSPRWWCVVPWAILLPLALVAGRRTVVVALGGAALTVFGIAHFEVPRWPRPTAPRALRLVTYNTDFSLGLAFRLRDDVETWQADVILLHDCKTIVRDSLRAIFPGAVAHGRFCFASRWPLVDVTDAVDLARAGDPRIARYRDAVRFRVQTPQGVLPVYSVHLPSPRQALAAARWPDPPVMRSLLRRSLAERGGASAAVSSAVRRTEAAFIVAGDFNLPYGSRLLTRDWGDLTNAFASAGTGFGHTMQAGIFPVRIDHVLLSPTLVPTAARVLSGYPSEHQPVLVDIARRAPD